MENNKAHSWIETLDKERRGNMILDALFGKKYIIVKATRAHQRQKIDRFHINKIDGKLIYRVDYKADEMAAKTHNLALEDVSVERNGTTIAKGWVHITIADLLVSYVPEPYEKAFVLKLEDIRKKWDLIFCTYPPIKTSTSNDHGIWDYNTWNCCPKIKWLLANGLISQTIEVQGAQLRLDLKK